MHHLCCLTRRACLSSLAVLPTRLQDPSGATARRALQAVLQLLGRQLASSHSWQHRELRNPLADASLPPLLALPPGPSLAVQSLANYALQAAVPGQGRPVRGVLQLYGPHLLWSGLPPRDTAALFALIATGLLHASASSGGNHSSTGGGGGSASGDVATEAGPDLRALDGGCWQQLPSGFLALRGSLDAAITRDSSAAVQVPLVRLQLAASSSQAEAAAEGRQHGDGARWDREQQGALAGEKATAAEEAAAAVQGGGAGGYRAYHLLPLLEGKLLLGLLLEGGTQLSAQLLAQLHALLAGPAKQLAAQVGAREEMQCPREQSWAYLLRMLSYCQRPALLRMPTAVCIAATAHLPAPTLPFPSPPLSCRWARSCAPARWRRRTSPASDTCTKTGPWAPPAPPPAPRCRP